MKVLISTQVTQGRRANDFNFTNPDELVTFGSQCDNSTPDDKCGCARALVGIESRKATTTFKVVDRDMTILDLAMKLKPFFDTWVEDDQQAQQYALDDAREINRLARFFEEGDVLEKRGESIKIRRQGVN